MWAGCLCVGVTLCYHLCTYLLCALFRLILTGPCQKLPKYLTKQKYSPWCRVSTHAALIYLVFTYFSIPPQVQSSNRERMMCNQPLNMQCSITIWMWALDASNCRRMSMSSIQRMHSNYPAWVCVFTEQSFRFRTPSLIRKKHEREKKKYHYTIPGAPLIMCIFYWKLVLLYVSTPHSKLQFNCAT